MPIPVSCPSCQGKFNAPDGSEGKKAKCPTCGATIQIPGAAAAEEIFDAEEVPQPFDDDEYEVEPPVETPATSEPRKPCPMCGEMIAQDAVKCRFCGEIFDPVLRAEAEKQKRVTSGDENLSAFEWVIAILCSGIGCIVGIVYMVQGKPKGTKMFLVSFCMQILWGLLQAALEVAIER